MPGKSSYKIKYFGFDDLSESDSDEESSQAKEKKTKRAAAVLAALSSSMDSPHTSDSQDSQTSNTGELMLLIWSYNHINNLIPVYSYIDYQHIQPSSIHVQKFTPILFVQQMLSTSLMTPVLVALRATKDAQGKKVIKQKRALLDSKRSSVDPKRF